MGKGSWSGIWEMFAALVFYDLVTTMVMIMWKDGEVLAVQCSAYRRWWRERCSCSFI